MRISLYWKIIFSYIVLLTIIIFIIGLVHYERGQRAQIEQHISEIYIAQEFLNETHRKIIELSLLGESVFNWNKEDYRYYCEKEEVLKALLLTAKLHNKGLTLYEQLDTISQLFNEKEKHLFHIMNTVEQRAYADSLLIHKLPLASRRATQSKQVVRRKKGLLGFLGGKKKIDIPPSPKVLFSLNNTIIDQQKKYAKNMTLYADSLSKQNTLLNDKLNQLLILFSKHVQMTLLQKEMMIRNIQRSSSTWMTVGLCSVFSLLILSSVILNKYIKRNQKDRLQLEEINGQNKEMLEMRKKIILTVSHDIRGPLTTINGSAELALKASKQEKKDMHLKNIIASGKHILRLVNSLLDIYRLNESKETLNNFPFSLHRLFNRITSEFMPIANNKGLAFSVQMPQINFTLKGDADRIEQITDNLLSNAIKFTETGSIQLTVDYNIDKLIITIHDTGIGMDKETMQYIFNPFERASNNTNVEGFGLGLSITKRLVNLLSGEISVESQLEKGSTFTVLLPLTQTNEKIAEEKESIFQNPCFSQRILIIDDDPMILEIAKEMLERNGMYCQTCKNSKDVVQEMRQNNFDLILTDIQMPGASGFHLLDLLRNSTIGNSKTIPILAMTARGDKSITAFTNAGFAGCIYKPFEQRDLLAAIDSATKKVYGKSLNFTAFTTGVTNKQKILRLFKDETQKNIQDLQNALYTLDIEKLQQTVHCMLPLWEMTGCEEILQIYGLTLREDKMNATNIRKQTEDILSYAKNLIINIENEITRWKNEENTDC